MNKTISVTGIGSVSAAPDTIVISLTLSIIDKDHSKAMDSAAVQEEELRRSIASAGISGSELKTTAFNVRTEYSSVQDEHGNYQNVFSGYRCSHSFSLEINLDIPLLEKVLSAVASGASEPELSISFTVRDTASLTGTLLENAAENARSQAEILCRASGASLGELIRIDHVQKKQSFTSDTRYDIEMNCLYAAGAGLRKSVSIEPDNITLTDSAEFVWELL